MFAGPVTGQYVQEPASPQSEKSNGASMREPLLLQSHNVMNV